MYVECRNGYHLGFQTVVIGLGRGHSDDCSPSNLSPTMVWFLKGLARWTSEEKPIRAARNQVPKYSLAGGMVEVIESGRGAPSAKKFSHHQTAHSQKPVLLDAGFRPRKKSQLRHCTKMQPAGGDKRAPNSNPRNGKRTGVESVRENEIADALRFRPSNASFKCHNKPRPHAACTIHIQRAGLETRHTKQLNKADMARKKQTNKYSSPVSSDLQFF